MGPVGQQVDHRHGARRRRPGRRPCAPGSGGPSPGHTRPGGSRPGCGPRPRPAPGRRCPTSAPWMYTGWPPRATTASSELLRVRADGFSNTQGHPPAARLRGSAAGSASARASTSPSPSGPRSSTSSTWRVRSRSGQSCPSAPVPSVDPSRMPNAASSRARMRPRVAVPGRSRRRSPAATGRSAGRPAAGR